ncbi:hypothetical protein EUGRSUZ_F03943 [Eucalyptus grandis]|uniref:Small ribosomal subunit protein uS15c n=2 Tax=Eucalyptus grandis TaxID=71139 RepID=A0A059BX13_EUCGR|nr:hypothetical protein EUGRSUZ_F03943 [Eucalyptus grandis]
MALQLRSRRKPLPSPSLIRFFSSEKPDPDAESPRPNFAPGDADSRPQPSAEPPSLSNYLNKVKARLRQQQQHNRPSLSSPFPASNAPKEEILKNLSEFRRRSAAPGPADSNARPVTFQELYNRNVVGRKGEANPGGGPEGGPAKPGEKVSMEPFRESLRQMQFSQKTGSDALPKRGDPMPLSRFRDALRMRPGLEGSGSGSGSSTMGIGGGENLPLSVFGKEMRERKEGEGKESSGRSKTEFLKSYSYTDLGAKLKTLRPESAAKGGDGKGWFSLGELNERLVKLREMEDSQTGEAFYRDLRISLGRIKSSDDERMKKTSFQRLHALGQLGGTPDFMLQPPKEHLVEKYFHPDNMSSAEKLKIQLAQVREEFKMSESDCGSARVQVAQLTTKIKHLAQALHKKDKHSRKGLQAMVQRRKTLLKYLRRTDWDSYCLVLSKLGLRDNPDYKHA